MFVSDFVALFGLLTSLFPEEIQRPLIIAVIVLLAIIIIVYAHHKIKLDLRFLKYVVVFLFSKMTKLFARPYPHCKYKCAKYTYRYDERWVMQNTQCLKIVITSSEFNHNGIEFKQKWTGSDVDKKQVPFKYTCNLDNEYKIEPYDGTPESPITDGNHHYKLLPIDQTQHIEKGTVISNIKLDSGKVKDEGKTSLPYYSVAMSVPTDKLTIEIRFKKVSDLEITKIQGEIYLRSLDTLPYLTVPCTGRYGFEKDEDKSEIGDIYYRWDIKNPIYGGKYLIRWTFRC